jgi:exodeoxyribonuclease VII large subunit
MKVEEDLLKALKSVKRKIHDFEAIVIVRGGGSKVDLAAFDSLSIGKAIANCSIPVFVGIGHDIDQSVTDIVAHSSLKTPTAVADFLIERNLNFESEIIALETHLRQTARRRLDAATHQMEQTKQWFKILPGRIIQSSKIDLENMQHLMRTIFNNRLNDIKTRLDKLDGITHVLDPKSTLKRGFSMTMKEGKLIRSSLEIRHGDEITTELWEGKIISKVKETDQ